MTQPGRMTAVVMPGPGTAAIGPSCFVLVPESARLDHQVLLTGVSDADPLDAVLLTLTEHGFRSTQAFVLVIAGDDDTVTVIVRGRGAVRARLIGGGERSLEDGDVATWLEERWAGVVDVSAWIGEPQPHREYGDSPSVAVGVVPAAGVLHWRPPWSRDPPPRRIAGRSASSPSGNTPDPFGEATLAGSQTIGRPGTGAAAEGAPVLATNSEVSEHSGDAAIHRSPVAGVEPLELVRDRGEPVEPTPLGTVAAVVAHQFDAAATLAPDVGEWRTIPSVSSPVVEPTSSASPPTGLIDSIPGSVVVPPPPPPGARRSEATLPPPPDVRRPEPAVPPAPPTGSPVTARVPPPPPTVGNQPAAGSSAERFMVSPPSPTSPGSGVVGAGLPPTDADATMTSEQLKAMLGQARTGGGTAAPALSGTPTIPAVHCPNGHPNAPEAAECQVCGTTIGDRSIRAVPRPVLGRLQFDTGQIVELARPLLIGRNPPPGELVAGEEAQVVAIPDPAKELSRLHAEVRIERWQVVVADRGSTNGTAVTLPGRAEVRLSAGEHLAIVPGTTVRLTETVSFRYDGPAG